jgi:hypothetical protein
MAARYGTPARGDVMDPLAGADRDEIAAQPARVWMLSAAIRGCALTDSGPSCLPTPNEPAADRRWTKERNCI